ncbi:UTP--glucose-1-phosphate uridylyltransferase [Marisediminitalea aggregata]|jgi:UTP--glucose-1-phosphate uridylyltransferase|uniref:UTP--glucose-1-phosphate uridylyltransferase n=1 Tax=Marisediminitalea aggregata TaxID=634436 RepID=A0A1M5LD22_9ALTE|nr:UTP--glucose-1-phosphate uridylyltransferase GalU [Marisediminitalea aggregata]MAP21440.1 UTP--glucose-1-phosphate uridylyltransferase [Alteromonadaceae bacterium]MEC7826848.1 UTP--glucose-1-phosphate uridylyltransferase GalU [Pseudomonadota bacterium]BBO26797.1 UTP--glucose-1-phosphate uridylyltransferase [Alteromonas sp. I4]HBY38949.1 UTP--glucose-1-phosphate uridylyltransferase [Alteromonas sp.]MAX42641.1 UTP--glucose-1-phosphate uridylyltransferase [Alteromonadaceae bacterium]|tara:strand:+ start:1218 stop:2111 length:894 start_codon:yes stop_codon:yes gene_type:complete
MSQVKKAVIPVAGLGTRMLPATKAIPKEMLPVVDKPLIQYVVNECVQAGLKEIILVTHASKNSIENHFDTSFELETTLEQRVKRQLLEEVQSICPKDVTIMHVRQGAAKGLGHAIMCAHPMVGDDPFAVVLPDVIIDEYTSNPKKDNLAEMVSRFNTSRVSQVMVEQVPQESISKFGIVDLEGASIKPGESAKIYDMVEKPPLEEAPSDLAVVGRYVLSQEIWSLLEFTPPGAGGEIQLTDAISSLMKVEQVDAYYMKGKSHDCGSKLGYMKANVEYALRHPSLGAEFKEYLASLNG